MTSPPPLSGLRVVELAGLAPGPFAGLLLADYGAAVLRVDRAHPKAHAESDSTSSTPSDSPSPTTDSLVRHKSSIAIDLKSARGIVLLRTILTNADVLIEPFRPGVLEKLDLAPSTLHKLNPRLVIARMTGFRRDGKYAQMAGHDINYIAVSGVLSILGRKGEKPYPPGNILGDFAGGGAVCFMGILMALLARERTGKGQVVEANMVDGSAFMATFPRLLMKKPMWNSERGTNTLDGGAPFYDTYETKDGRFLSVGAIEPQFFNALLAGLELKPSDLPGSREDKRHWPAIADVFTRRFKTKTRAEWEQIFDGTDACVAPVLTQDELETSGYDQRPIVTLTDTPGFAISTTTADVEHRPAAEGQGAGVRGSGWSEEGLAPGDGGEETLRNWLGWQRGRHYNVERGGLVLTQELADKAAKARL